MAREDFFFYVLIPSSEHSAHPFVYRIPGSARANMDIQEIRAYTVS